MDVAVPPWLNVGPQSFGNAAAEGAHLDLARQQADVEAAMNATRLQIQKQQQDREFAMQEQQEAFNREMKRTQISMAAQQVARKFQAQQQYQQLVAQGMEPAQAMLHVGPALGINMVGAGQLAHWGTPPPPPTMIEIGGKKFAQYNRTLHPIKDGPDWVDEDINGHKFQRNTTTGELKPVLHSDDVTGPMDPMTKARINVLMKKRQQLALTDLDGSKTKAIDDELDRLTGAGQQDDSGTPPATAPAPAPGGATSRFKIVAVQ